MADWTPRQDTRSLTPVEVAKAQIRARWPEIQAKAAQIRASRGTSFGIDLEARAARELGIAIPDGWYVTRSGQLQESTSDLEAYAPGFLGIAAAGLGAAGGFGGFGGGGTAGGVGVGETQAVTGLAGSGFGAAPAGTSVLGTGAGAGANALNDAAKDTVSKTLPTKLPDSKTPNPLSKIPWGQLAALFAAAGMTSATRPNGSGDGFDPAGVQPEFKQLLGEAMKRMTSQGPLFDAATKQAYGGLPTYAKGGL